MAVKSKPFTIEGMRRTLALERLRSELHDDRFLDILLDLSRPIAVSEKRCTEASENDDQDLAEYVIDAETGYVEELIGQVFLILQTKIRRVTEAAKRLSIVLGDTGREWPQELACDDTIWAIGGHYGTTTKSLVAIVWAVGNYYKHRDEWPPCTWRDEEPEVAERNAYRRSVGTRRTVQLAGVKQSSTGNMRTCLAFLGVDPYSNCPELGERVREWSVDVMAVAELAVATAKVSD